MGKGMLDFFWGKNFNDLGCYGLLFVLMLKSCFVIDIVIGESFFCLFCWIVGVWYDLEC